MMDWLEENGGAIVGIGIIVFFGWMFLSNLSPSDSSTSSQSLDSYESSSDDSYYSNTGAAEPEEFYGYECTDDCSGHEAGYEWADENSLCYEYSSGDEYWDSYSDSFNEGATAYIEENC